MIRVRPGRYTRAIMESQGTRLATPWCRDEWMLRWSMRHYAEDHPDLRVLYLVSAIVPKRPGASIEPKVRR